MTTIGPVFEQIVGEYSEMPGLSRPRKPVGCLGSLRITASPYCRRWLPMADCDAGKTVVTARRAIMTAGGA